MYLLRLTRNSHGERVLEGFAMSRAAGMQEHRRLSLPGQSDLNVEYRLHVVSAGREDGGCTRCSGDVKWTIDRQHNRLDDLRCSLFQYSRVRRFRSLGLRLIGLVPRCLVLFSLHTSCEYPGPSQVARCCVRLWESGLRRHSHGLKALGLGDHLGLLGLRRHILHA